MKNAFPITVICDNIREPGNLGAVLRTLTAVGISQIILMKGKYDYNHFFLYLLLAILFKINSVIALCLRLYGSVGK